MTNHIMTGTGTISLYSHSVRLQVATTLFMFILSHLITSGASKGQEANDDLKTVRERIAAVRLELEQERLRQAGRRFPQTETARERFLQDSRGAPYSVDKAYHSELDSIGDPQVSDTNVASFKILRVDQECHIPGIVPVASRLALRVDKDDTRLRVDN